MDLRDDYGCFFIKMKNTHDVGFVIYIKTNFLLKNHPKNKLNYFDDAKKAFSTKPYSPNKIWYIGFSGKDGVGGDALDEYTKKEFRKLFATNIDENYNYTDYPLSEELYAAMKKSNTGIPSEFTKEWVEEQYKFIEGQFAIIDKKREKLVPTRPTSSARSHTKHRRHRKNRLSRTRKHLS